MWVPKTNDDSTIFRHPLEGSANSDAWEVDPDRVVQVTNLVSGAYTPAPSPDGTRLAYIGYTRRGFDIYLLQLEPGLERPAPAYVDDQRQMAAFQVAADVLDKGRGPPPGDEYGAHQGLVGGVRPVPFAVGAGAQDIV